MTSPKPSELELWASSPEVAPGKFDGKRENIALRCEGARWLLSKLENWVEERARFYASDKPGERPQICADDLIDHARELCGEG